MPARTVKPFIPCTRWRIVMHELRAMRKASRLARRRNDIHLTNSQIRRLVIAVWQAKNPNPTHVATLQQRLKTLNEHIHH